MFNEENAKHGLNPSDKREEMFRYDKFNIIENIYLLSLTFEE